MITRARIARLGAAATVCAVVLLAAAGALWHSGASAIAPLTAAGSEALHVVDRHGRPLRVLPAPGGRGVWTPLDRIPAVLREIVIAGEDRRFEQHAGVDLRSIARAAYTNLRAGRTVSGASTITMQLARLLHPELRTRAWSSKLQQAWLAVAIELRLDKAEILEAYLNLAYFGGGATGAGDAAQRWFGKPLAALADGELALLAVLPRAPSAYDPSVHLAAALQRRDALLARVVTPGRLDEIAREPLAVAAARKPPAFLASHFLDWLLPQLPETQRRAGGTVRTTLDRDLQLQLERAAAEHVASLGAAAVEQAGLIVIETQSGAIRALVGSRDYASSQVNIVTRRRFLGSLLKPFVYALAIEAGDRANSTVIDAGDTASAYRARNWIGREAGPLSYREALAGSYNLAAVHVLERVGVSQLHARLRLAGVADLPHPPARYGLELALGSAQVRLIDVVSGYGFLVREGRVRSAYGIERLDRSAGSWRPAAPAERQVFSREVSFEVMDVLSDPAARHRRFGRGLPIDGPLRSDGEVAPRIVAKTGTASGMSDLSAVLATREFLVGAWSGRFDGSATHGVNGMWGAGPLAQRALEIALRGRAPTLPQRPATLPPLPPSPPVAAADGGGEAKASDGWAQRARAGGRFTLR